MTVGPLIQISPRSPAGMSRPSSDTTRNSIVGAARPTEPGWEK